MMMDNRKLFRTRTGNMLGGVCAGLARYLNTDPTVLRLIFVLLAVFGFHGVLIYIVLWLLMPLEPTAVQ
jgi:phage shock protein C